MLILSVAIILLSNVVGETVGILSSLIGLFNIFTWCCFLSIFGLGEIRSFSCAFFLAMLWSTVYMYYKAYTAFGSTKQIFV